MKPTCQTLIDELRAGFVTLRIDYYKSSGKWHSGGFVRLNLEELLKIQNTGYTGLSNPFLDYLDKRQGILIERAYKEYYVTVTEQHYEEIEAYTHFFTRMYQPC